jgi:hypothetical protein
MGSPLGKDVTKPISIEHPADTREAWTESGSTVRFATVLATVA